MKKNKEKLEILKQLDEYKTFGTQLSEAMYRQGYSKQALSEELIKRGHYIVEKTIDKWQKDLAYPDITIMYILAEILELNINNLLISKQLMQQMGLSSINMVLIKKICKFFDKSLVFAYYFIKIGLWVGLILALCVVWGLKPNIFVLIIFAILAGFGTYYSLN